MWASLNPAVTNLPWRSITSVSAVAKAEMVFESPIAETIFPEIASASTKVSGPSPVQIFPFTKITVGEFFGLEQVKKRHANAIKNTVFFITKSS